MNMDEQCGDQAVFLNQQKIIEEWKTWSSLNLRFDQLLKKNKKQRSKEIGSKLSLF